jgi:hypothetical protein
MLEDKPKLRVLDLFSGILSGVFPSGWSARAALKRRRSARLNHSPAACWRNTGQASRSMTTCAP